MGASAAVWPAQLEGLLSEQRVHCCFHCAVGVYEGLGAAASTVQRCEGEGALLLMPSWSL